MKKYFLVVALLALIFTAGISTAAHAATADLSGWGWSSNIGWISFNSSDTGAGGGPYKVTVDTATGNFGGYAWSSNIGWISFNSGDLTVAPACGSSPAHLDPSTGSVTGWIRAVIGEDAKSIGWDGCIELSGTNHLSGPSYLSGNGGVTFNPNSGPSQGKFVGYAWGGPVVGWLQFNPTASVNDASCTDCILVTPSTPSLSFDATYGSNVAVQNLTGANAVQAGSPVTLNWDIQNVTSCSTSGSDWSKVTMNSGNIASGITGSGTLLYSSGDVGTNRQLYINCQNNTVVPVWDRSAHITIDVVAAPPATLSCIQPTHSLSCPADANNIQSNPPAGQQTNVVSSCPSTGPAKYCTFTCIAPYVKNGNTCTRSDIDEI